MRFFSFLASVMDSIFGNNKDLKNKYRNLLNTVLPNLNNCNYCEVFKCSYCSKYSITCNLCRAMRCKNCAAFNKAKDILLNSGNHVVSNFVSNFLAVYLSMSELSAKFFNVNIRDDIKKKIF